jgi:uncharacterized membrane protein YsdA (DUF1294 family)
MTASQLVSPWTPTLGWLALLSLAGFALMGVDKARAQDRERRVPERWFLTLALVGGAVGILAGAFAFHHKTSKASFFSVVLLLTVLWIVILVELQRVLGSPLG